MSNLLIPTSNPVNWHGITPEDHLKNWDNEGWRESLVDALVDVASSEDALTKDRLSALGTLNEAIMNEVIEYESFPELMLDVLIAVTDGDQRLGFFARRRAKKLHSRLLGAQWMLRTSYQFFREIEAKKNAAPAKPDTAPTYS